MRYKVGLGVIFAVILIFSGRKMVNGQSPDWTQPEHITMPDVSGNASSIDYTMVGDSLGQIHFLWVSAPEKDSEATVLNYMKWDGIAWSQAIDVLVTPGGDQTQVHFPRAAIDQTGILHVVWGGNRPTNLGVEAYLYYSQAPAQDAANVHAWAPPRPLFPLGYISSGSGNPGDIVADQKGNLHVIFVDLSGDDVYYLQSSDHGQSWGAPSFISGSIIEQLPAEVMRATATSPRIIVDTLGRLHVAWAYFRIPGGWPTLGIRYARSLDEGKTWSEPFLIVDEKADQANLAVYGDTVHLLWAGMLDLSGRWHRISRDGGQTWEGIVRATPPEIWAHGDFSAVVDKSGVLHMIAGLTGFPGHIGAFLTYLEWRDGLWSSPEIIWDVLTEHPRAILVNDNQLHALCTDYQQADSRFFVHTMKKLPLPAAPVVLSVAPASAEPALTVTPEATVTPVLKQTNVVTAPYSRLPGPETTASNMLAALIVPTLLVVVIVSGALLMYQTRSRKRT